MDDRLSNVFTPSQGQPRNEWLEARQEMEARGQRRQVKQKHSWWSLKYRVALRTFEWGLKLTGLGLWGKAQSKKIQLQHLEIISSELPLAFSGFKILHLTDPHFDTYPEVFPHLLKKYQESVNFCDMVVMTGDYKNLHFGPTLLSGYFEALSHATPQDIPIYATLGNHDTSETIPQLEAHGITPLLNESLLINKGQEKIQVIGLDDVHIYRTETQESFLKQSKFEGFNILLCHSNELYESAAQVGVNLYLCGHSHGGQICLPGGIPILTHTEAPREFCSGSWQHGPTQGYTSRGAGVVFMPYRFFCPPEITLVELKQKGA